MLLRLPQSASPFSSGGRPILSWFLIHYESLKTASPLYTGAHDPERGVYLEEGEAPQHCPLDRRDGCAH